MKPKSCELPHLHGERVQEDDLDVEDDEQHRRQVVRDREARGLVGAASTTPDSNGLLLAVRRAAGRPSREKHGCAASRVPAIMAEKPMKTRIAAQWPSTLATIAHKRPFGRSGENGTIPL